MSGPAGPSPMTDLAVRMMPNLPSSDGSAVGGGYACATVDKESACGLLTHPPHINGNVSEGEM